MSCHDLYAALRRSRYWLLLERWRAEWHRQELEGIARISEIQKRIIAAANSVPPEPEDKP